jgi:hypothetical protein
MTVVDKYSFFLPKNLFTKYVYYLQNIFRVLLT